MDDNLVGAEAVCFQVHRYLARRGQPGCRPLQRCRRVHIVKWRRLQALKRRGDRMASE